jgi:hypothetical protein
MFSEEPLGSSPSFISVTTNPPLFTGKLIMDPVERFLLILIGIGYSLIFLFVAAVIFFVIRAALHLF